MVDRRDNLQLKEGIKIIKRSIIAKVGTISNQMCSSLAKTSVNLTRKHLPGKESMELELASNQAL